MGKNFNAFLVVATGFGGAGAVTFGPNSNSVPLHKGDTQAAEIDQITEDILIDGALIFGSFGAAAVYLALADVAPEPDRAKPSSQ